MNFIDILQMTSSSQSRGGRGRGNSPRGRGPGGRILSFQSYIDNEGFTMVASKNKRGGYIGSSSSSS